MSDRAVASQLRRYPPEHRDDLAQEWAAEQAQARLELRRPRRFAWVAADWYRRMYGRSGPYGRKERGVAVSLQVLPDLPVPPAPHFARAEKQQRSLLERGLHIARGLPPEQRTILVLILRCLGSRSPVERVRAWREAYPGRHVPHRVIALEVGVSRESVTRALAFLRRPGPRQSQKTP